MESDVSGAEDENSGILVHVTLGQTIMVPDEEQPSLISYSRFNYFRLVYIINLNRKEKKGRNRGREGRKEGRKEGRQERVGVWEGRQICSFQEPLLAKGP